MTEKYFENIKSGIDLRSNLLGLKNELKNMSPGSDFDRILAGSDVFLSLLTDSDPKVRQNAAQILGILKDERFTEHLVEAYLSDETNYNKSVYLEAIERCGYSKIKDRLLDRRNVLLKETCSPENKKHRTEEMHSLSILLQPEFKEHEFTGYDLENEFVLLTNRNFKAVTMEQLAGIPHKEFTAGVMVKTKKLDLVRKSIRTYSELLFIPDGIKLCSTDPVKAAEELIGAGIVKYLTDRLSDPDDPVYFRVEYRAKDKKRISEFEKKLSSELEFSSGFRLINSTGNYEVEMRFIDTSDNKLAVLIRFCTLKDRRFSYRSASIAVSLKPSTAALLMRLAGNNLKDNAAVLDPFCGCGTILAEREMAKSTRLCYGIDIMSDAVSAAHTNLGALGMLAKTELIKRDFFEFSHKYKFDEVFTDMPFVTEKKGIREIEELYASFFRKIPSMLEKDAMLFIYSRNRDFLRKYSLSSGFKIISEFEISKMEGSYFFILTGK